MLSFKKNIMDSQTDTKSEILKSLQDNIQTNLQEDSELLVREELKPSRPTIKTEMHDSLYILPVESMHTVKSENGQNPNLKRGLEDLQASDSESLVKEELNPRTIKTEMHSSLNIIPVESVDTVIKSENDQKPSLKRELEDLQASDSESLVKEELNPRTIKTEMHSSLNIIPVESVDTVIKSENDQKPSLKRELEDLQASDSESLVKEELNSSTIKTEMHSSLNIIPVESVDTVIKSENGQKRNLKRELDDPQTSDPYAYLERNGFTSEIFKIEIRGLPKFYGIGELKKLLNKKLKLGSNKIKTPKTGSQWLYVCFRCEEDKEEALKVLNGLKWKNRTLSAFAAKPAPDPLVKRRNEALSDGPDNTNKRKKLNETGTQLERLKDSTVPLWRLSPEEQAAKKTENVTKILRNMVFDMEKQNISLKRHFCAQRDKNGGIPLKMNNIVQSPYLNGYRNKCEFTIGIDGETDLPTVGMRLGSYATGTIGVAPVDDLPHVSDRMKQAVKVFEGFVRSSALPVFDPETYTGYWRQLTVRWGSRTDQLMLIVGIHPQLMSTEEKDSFKEELKVFFASGEGQSLNVTSIFYQEITKRRSGEEQVLEFVGGESHITEELCGLRFSISPLSFFQVNTGAAELLYDAVGALTQLTVETTLVDVCCGTGSIGLSLAKNCGQVLGLELNEKAIEDARQNAAENNITNCEFFSGPAEDILQSVVDRAKHPDVVAVVDPPRAGLRQNAVVMLRRISKIKKIAYVACDLKCVVKNIVDLARPASKTLAGDPFVPMAVTPVDLFPHTDHCEVVIYLERFDVSKEEI